MTRTLQTIFIVASLYLAAAGCGGDPAAPEAETAAETASPLMAIIEYQNPVNDPDFPAKYAAADLVVFASPLFLGNGQTAGMIDELRALNPRIKVLGYQLAQTSRISAGELGPDSADPYSYDWYVATRPYWSFTTAGDTLSNWAGQAVLDILDPACRAAMIDVIARYHREGHNRLDGVMWDYFGTSLWIPPDIAADTEGDPDLDGDGVPHFEDPDEQAALRAAQESLVRELRAEMGESFVQVFNGSRALSDSTFAALGDGMLYEIFPQVGFSSGSDKYRQALLPENPNNLFAAGSWPRTRNGGPWLILSNNWQIGFTNPDGVVVDYNLGNLNRAVALLTGAAAAYHSDGRITYGWPDVEVDLGEPLGPTEIDGDTYHRSFARGEITVVIESGAYPMPFDFEIVQDGEVVQYLDFPDYFP